MKNISSLLMTLALGLGLVTQSVHCTENTPKPQSRWTFPNVLRGICFSGTGYFAGRVIADQANRAPQNRTFDNSTKVHLGVSATLFSLLGIDYFIQKRSIEKKRQQKMARAERTRSANSAKNAWCLMQAQTKNKETLVSLIVAKSSTSNAPFFQKEIERIQKHHLNVVKAQDFILNKEGVLSDQEKETYRAMIKNARSQIRINAVLQLAKERIQITKDIIADNQYDKLRDLRRRS